MPKLLWEKNGIASAWFHLETIVSLGWDQGPVLKSPQPHWVAEIHTVFDGAGQAMSFNVSGIKPITKAVAANCCFRDSSAFMNTQDAVVQHI